MRCLTVLAFVFTGLALATKPHPPGTEQGATDSSLEHIARHDVENVDSDSVKVIRSDDQAPYGGLEKRIDGIPIPTGPNPEQLTMAGVLVSFTMVGQWIRKEGGSTLKYVCSQINIRNPTTVNKVVTLASKGVTLLKNQPFTHERVMGIKAPEGGFGQTFDIVVGNQRGS
ncbi:hypothetical protein FOMG_18653 [Fusarium oxysporum f. sp. melonis 26406]|uniref:Uncharacterized protein n=2 Tax=Fusarium oxysporum TaxID=5507 RepID=A0A2H3G287_FUSOX|nr:hypothetical protein FOMG_18653 [Fusarium oxysporum f. sp. melonis 26406]PCD21988.1 hypothetical protein AU210_015791 [Fusarium oxysporum f. sp. radicis-cucumerinum]